MAKTVVKALGAAILSLGVVLATAELAAAKGGPKGFSGKGAGKAHAMAPGGFAKGEKMGWHGGNRPPGWNRGRKTGWQGGSMPPGLR
jgi:hypothetical protein